MIHEDGMNKLKFLGILQARTSSTRLPGKVLKELNGKSMIEWQIQRILQSNIKQIVLATSTDESDDNLATLVSKMGIEVFRGPLDDVLERFLQVLKKHKPSHFVRLTGDCPLVMPEIINEMLEAFEYDQFDYYTNSVKRTYPDGLDVEIVKSSALQKLNEFQLSPNEREHVTLGFRTREKEFALGYHTQVSNLKDLRWTVDTQADLDFVREVFKNFKSREDSFSYSDLLEFLEINLE